MKRRDTCMALGVAILAYDTDFMRDPAHPGSTVCTIFRLFLERSLHQLYSEYSILAVARLGFAHLTFPLSAEMRGSIGEPT